METASLITSYIQKRIGPEVTLKADDDIFALGFVNSMFALQLVSFLEQEFQIQVENEDLDLANFNSVNNIEAFIARKTGKAGTQ